MMKFWIIKISHLFNEFSKIFMKTSEKHEIFYNINSHASLTFVFRVRKSHKRWTRLFWTLACWCWHLFSAFCWVSSIKQLKENLKLLLKEITIKNGKFPKSARILYKTATFSRSTHMRVQYFSSLARIWVKHPSY